MNRERRSSARAPAPRGPRAPGGLVAAAALVGVGLLGFFAWARWGDGDAPVRAAAPRLTTPSPRSPRLGADTSSRREAPPERVEPARRAVSDPGLDEGDDGEPADGGAPVARAADIAAEHEAITSEPPSSTPSAALAPHALPPGHPPLTPGGEASAVEPPAPEARERRVETVTLSRWQQPGLCGTSDDALGARQRMMQRFRQQPWEEATLYLDPRLAAGAEEPLLDALAAAESDVRAQLRLAPGHPDVFAYRDSELLLAAACTNDDVVAYYDGALHVVATHGDVATSVVHEYTHHALISAGIVGPAWAQEGVAMTVARETWWKQPQWLDRVAARPFSLDVMESAVPYTLRSDQALLFYVQAAAMVACALRDEPGGVAGLVRSLAERSSGGAVDYTLPPLAEPRALRACRNALLE
jgi:hypothetical protein